MNSLNFFLKGLFSFLIIIFLKIIAVAFLFLFLRTVEDGTIDHSFRMAIGVVLVYDFPGYVLFLPFYLLLSNLMARYVGRQHWFALFVLLSIALVLLAFSLWRIGSFDFILQYLLFQKNRPNRFFDDLKFVRLTSNLIFAVIFVFVHLKFLSNPTQNLSNSTE